MEITSNTYKQQHKRFMVIYTKIIKRKNEHIIVYD